MQRGRLGTGTGHPPFFVQGTIHTEHVGIGVRKRQNAKQRCAYHFKPKRALPPQRSLGVPAVPLRASLGNPQHRGNSSQPKLQQSRTGLVPASVGVTIRPAGQQSKSKAIWPSIDSSRNKTVLAPLAAYPYLCRSADMLNLPPLVQKSNEGIGSPSCLAKGAIYPPTQAST